MPVEILPPGEILPPEPVVHVQSIAAPFRSRPVANAVRAGLTISGILDELGLDDACRIGAYIWVDDVLIPAEWWGRVKPKAGHLLVVRVWPQGGNGGKILRSVLTIAVIAVSAFLFLPAGLALGGALGGALGIGAWAGTALGISVTGMLGMLAVNALIPPPHGSTPATLYTLSPGSNAGRPYQPIPVILGRQRVFCDYATSAVSEAVGNDQYVRLLFCVGYGPLLIEDIKLGDTPIGNYTDVQMEVRQGYPTDAPVTLYTDTPVEIAPNIQLRQIDDWQTREIDQNATELQVDFLWGAGLYRIVDGSNHKPTTVALQVQYALIDTQLWMDAPNGGLTVTAETQQFMRRSLSWAVPSGRYQIRVRRTTQDHEGDSNWCDAVTWAAMRAIQPGYPIKFQKPVALIALRLKANNQLNGSVQTLNCIATSILPDWDAPTQTWISRATGNPAAAFRALLQGPATMFPQPDSKLDLPGLQDWAAANTAANRMIGWTINDNDTLLNRLRQCASVGRAQFIMRDGIYSIVRDVAQDLPVQMFTPRNSWGFKASRSFPLRLPHGIRVRFRNPQQYWQIDERIAYADGYDENTATVFEMLDLSKWVCDADQAWKEARYHWAQAILRPWVYEKNVDIENLVAQRGDLVNLATDVMAIGIVSGRIKAIAPDGVTLTSDETLMVDGSASYLVNLRLPDGSQALIGVTLATGGTHTMTLAAPIPGLAPGDLFTLGEAGRVVKPTLVKAIYPGKDLSARIQFVDAAPEVLAADSGAIPPWDSHLTAGTPIAAVTGLILTETEQWVNGSTQPVLTISWDRSADIRVDTYSVWAQSPSGSWTKIPLTSPTVATIAPAALGPWSVTVWAVAGDGRESVGATATLTVDGIGDLLSPDGMAITQYHHITADGTVTLGIQLTWTPTAEAAGQGLVAQWRPQGAGSWTQAQAAYGAGSLILTPVAELVTYEVQTATVLLASGVRSPWSAIQAIAIQSVMGDASVSNLELYNQGAGTTFVGRDIHLSWIGNFPATAYDIGSEPYGAGSGITNPYFKCYVITVTDPATGAVVRRDYSTVQPGDYTYTYQDNVLDGGPRRSLTFTVAILDKLGGQTPGVSITVSNPVPAPVQLRPLPTTAGTLLLGYIPPTGTDALDFAGVNIWYGATAAVDTSGTPAVTGSSPPLVLGGLTPGATVYIVSQTFDTFGSIGCPISAPLAVILPLLSAADMAKAIIGNDQLTPDLASAISLVTADATVANSVAARVAAEASARGAAIESVQEVIGQTAAEVTALASQVADQSNGLKQANATIQNIDQATTSNAAALQAAASHIETLQATVDGNTSAIQGQADGLQKANSAIQTVEEATASNAGVLQAAASHIETLQTAVDGHTSSIQQMGATVNGLTAEMYFKVDSNGNVAGIGEYADPNGSRIGLLADVLTFALPSATNPKGYVTPFSVGTYGGQPTIVLDGAVYTGPLHADQIAAGTMGADVVYAGTVKASQIGSGYIGTAKLWATANGLISGPGLILDGTANQMTIGDGTHTRVLVGEQGSDYGIWTWDASGAPVIVGGALGNNIVNTQHILNNAVTAAVGVTTGRQTGDFDSANASGLHSATVVSASITNSGYPVSVTVNLAGWFMTYWGVNNGTNYGASRIELQRDGVSILTYYSYSEGNNGYEIPGVMLITDNPGGSSHTYSVVIYGSGQAQWYDAYDYVCCSMQLLVVKK